MLVSAAGVTIVERPSQILVEVAGHPIITADLMDDRISAAR
jgi:hypothetical protein